MSAVNNVVTEEADAVSTPGKHEHRSKRNVFNKSYDSLVSSKVASKLEEGIFNGMVRLACAVNITADHSLEALKRKYLEAHLGFSIMPSTDPCLFSF